jgi:hypothetical protein
VSCREAEGSFCYAPIGLTYFVSCCQMLCSLPISYAVERRGQAEVLFLLTACRVRREQLCKNLYQMGACNSGEYQIFSTKVILTNPGGRDGSGVDL